MLRIGQLAAAAGTTTRAVRHYHAVGVLPEPEREESGYRRYGPEDLVALVRIRRLRALGMPLEEIGGALAGDGRALPDALRALAGDLEAQIEVLQEMRARVLDLAGEKAPVAPAEAWAETLRLHGVLAPGAPLPDGERRAAEVLDALHPEGVAGVAGDLAPVLGDPAIVGRLGPLLARFRGLASDAEADALADELVAALPPGPRRPPLADVATMDALLGDHLMSAQRRCMHRVRARLEAG
jgi:DNA-binding transcriptional MerR regulator